MAETRPRSQTRRPKPTPKADLFGQVVHAVNVAYYEWDVAGDDVRISPAFAVLFGSDPSVMSRDFYDQFFHPDDVPGYRAAIIDAFKGRAERVETTYRMKSGHGDYL